MIIVVLLITVIYYSDLKQKYNSVANRYADLWCKSQTYEKTLVEEQRNYTDEFYTKTLSSEKTDSGLDFDVKIIKNFETGKYIQNNKIECIEKGFSRIFEFNV